MSSICRVCIKPMPKDRKGYQQVCPLCKEKGHKELIDPTFDYEEDRKLTEKE